MNAFFRKLRTAALCVVCATSLTLPAWAAQSADIPPVGPVMESGRISGNVPDNDALFYGYLLRRAGASDEASLMTDARSRLSETDKATYDKLKPMIQEIAAGTRTDTHLTVAYSGFPYKWTAADLGVNSIISGGAIAQDAADALYAKMCACFVTDAQSSPGAIVEALRFDCPYEMYWFDGTNGYSSNLSESLNKIGAAGRNGEYYMTPGVAPEDGQDTVTLTYEFTLPVSPDYGGGTTVDRSLRTGIDNVVTKAKSIVSANASKSDYDKMLAYSAEICNLVKYDTAAASDPSTPYGDPWQIISVFDGDDNTNVVCEGYAKAFQYLCDLGAFNSSAVQCHLATGTLSGGTGVGPHMWNIVTMENGKSYLVDVTNSDSNGRPEYLLLKGGSPSASNPREYVFYNWLAFAYDDNTVRLWGDALLTLDTVDYKDAPKVSRPLRISGYSLSGTGKAVRMDDLRNGAEIKPDITALDNALKSATVFLAVYDSQGKMAALQSWKLDFSQPDPSFQTQPLPHGADASSAKLIIVGETFAPLDAAFSL